MFLLCYFITHTFKALNNNTITNASDWPWRAQAPLTSLKTTTVGTFCNN